MRHASFLKLVSRELGDGGRMVDVDSVSICRCGRRFPTDEQLEAHVVRPITLFLSEGEQPPTNAAKTMEPVRITAVQVEH